MPGELITQAEYATRRGCSKVAVHKAVKAGRISLIDGKIDPTVADIQWAKNSRVRAGSTSSGADLGAVPFVPVFDGGDGGDYRESRARREAAEASIAELRLAELQGDLLRREAIRSALAPRIIALREGLMQIPIRVAAVIAAETDAVACQELLEVEIRQVLLDWTEPEKVL